ncbi:hypothetical protein UY3_13338 [Chelonia mydas]|uniref:Uncharacterized protein n=1 Tax=Chelonia mydas TaxID=8469 RepID=M7BBK0_CHEMY|nr:hypothetical protein UY3_13338 [Chelonia mydas]
MPVLPTLVITLNYHKARKANHRSGAAPMTCRFYQELDAIVGGDPTSTTFRFYQELDAIVGGDPTATPGMSMDTSEPSSTRQEEKEEQQSGSEGAEVEEDTPESLHACSQELFSSQEEGAYRHQLPATPVASPPSPENYDPYPLHSTPITMQYSYPEVQHALHST